VAAGLGRQPQRANLGLVYFLLQAVGILVERHFLNGHPRLMVMFVWLVVFVPLPLVLK
jgi:hypothetical protein